MKTIGLVSAVVIAMTVFSESSYADDAYKSGGARQEVSDANVLNHMHRLNQAEIQFGNLAESNGDSQEVKDYGKMLAADHHAADSKVMDVARSLNVAISDSTEGRDSKTTGSGSTSQTTGGDNRMIGGDRTTASDGRTAGTPGTGTGTTTGSERTAGTTGNTGSGTVRSGTTGTGAMGSDSRTAGTTGNTGSDRVGDSDKRMTSGDKKVSDAQKMDTDKKLTDLRQLSGRAFDQRFLQIMAAEHSKAVKDLKSNRSQVSEQVRTLIDQLVPQLEAHGSRATSLLTQISKRQKESSR